MSFSLVLSVSRLNDLFASSASNKARNQIEGKLMMMMIHDLSKSTRLERSSLCCTYKVVVADVIVIWLPTVVVLSHFLSFINDYTSTTPTTTDSIAIITR